MPLLDVVMHDVPQQETMNFHPSRFRTIFRTSDKLVIVEWRSQDSAKMKDFRWIEACLMLAFVARTSLAATSFSKAPLQGSHRQGKCRIRLNNMLCLISNLNWALKVVHWCPDFSSRSTSSLQHHPLSQRSLQHHRQSRPSAGPLFHYQRVLRPWRRGAGHVRRRFRHLLRR